MIFMTEGGISSMFCWTCRTASELAKASGETVVFFWNREAIAVADGMTPEDVERLDKVTSDLLALRARGRDPANRSYRR